MARSGRGRFAEIVRQALAAEEYAKAVLLGKFAGIRQPAKVTRDATFRAVRISPGFIDASRRRAAHKVHHLWC